ncbi:MAG TPA: hypothetical protein HPP94_04850 [Desulfuromonadales bacterium]|nr:hypothetical protein [Desulfuromonadales bacterium]
MPFTVCEYIEGTSAAYPHIILKGSYPHGIHLELSVCYHGDEKKWEIILFVQQSDLQNLDESFKVANFDFKYQSEDKSYLLVKKDCNVEQMKKYLKELATHLSEQITLTTEVGRGQI